MKTILLKDWPYIQRGLDPLTASIFTEDENTFVVIDEKIENKPLPGLPVAIFSPASRTLDLFEEAPSVLKTLRKMLETSHIFLGGPDYTILPVLRLQKELQEAKKPQPGVLPGSPADLRRKADVLSITAELRAYGVET